MPIIIVMSPADHIPAVIFADTDLEVLTALADLMASPPLASVEAAQQWLATLNEPSGWFDSASEASRYLNQFDGGAEVRLADAPTKQTWMRQRSTDLWKIIGFLDCSTDEASLMQRIELGRSWFPPVEAHKLRRRLARVERNTVQPHPPIRPWDSPIAARPAVPSAG